MLSIAEVRSNISENESIMASRFDINKKDDEFKQYLKEWLDSGKTDAKAWEEIWFRVQDCMHSLACKEYKGIYNSHFDDRLGNAVCAMMFKLKLYKGYAEELLEGIGSKKSRTTRHLTSYCYWSMLRNFRGEAAQQEDTEYSFELLEEQRRYDEIYNEGGEYGREQ